jgi:phospholipase C
MTHTANNPSSGVPNADLTPDGSGGFSLTSDAQPYYDDCSTRDAVALSGKNVGDLLNAKGVSWGWFQGGFRPSTPYATALTDIGVSQPTSTFVPDQFKALGATDPNVVAKKASNQGICNTATPIGVELPASLGTGTGQYGFKDDYIPHHEPFEYYASTANPHHLTIPAGASGQDTLAGLKTIGTDTQSYVGGVPQFNTPNHNYDMSDFDQLVGGIGKGTLPPSALPAVSFLKAPGWADGHAAYSDPIDEQHWLVNEINALEKTPDWSSTAVVISYDDSDGWYDHAYSGVTNPSASVADALTGAGACGTGTPLAGENGRCGLGPRLPLLVISPWAKTNRVDHTLTNQASITKFIEDNWKLPSISGSFDSISGSLNHLFDFDRHGDRDGDRLFLSPLTGEPSW